MSSLLPVRIVAAEHSIDIELYGDFGALQWAPVLAGAAVGAAIGALIGRGGIALAIGAAAGAGAGYAARGELLALALRRQLIPEPAWFNDNADPVRVHRDDAGVPYSVTW